MRQRLTFLFCFSAFILTCGGKPLYFAGQALTDAGSTLILKQKYDPNCLIFTVKTNAVFHRGDFLHIAGHTEINPARPGQTLKLIADVIRKTGFESLPPVRDVCGYEFKNPALVNQLVRIRGHVETAFIDDLDDRTVIVIVKTSSGNVPVNFSSVSHPLDELRALINAQVEIEGLVMRTSGFRNDLQFLLNPYNDKSVRILAPPPADSFDAPELSSASVTCKQRVDGIVIAMEKDRLHLRTDTGNYLSAKPQPGTALPEVGDHVTAVGFAENDAFNLQLIEAEFRITNSSRCQTKTDESVRLLDTPFNFVNDHYEIIVNNGEIVRCRGQIIATPAEKADTLRRFWMRTQNDTIDIDLSGIKSDFQPQVGTLLEVTGIAIAEYENATPGTTLPRFKRMTVLPRTRCDIRVLKPAPWWTPQRLLLIIATLLVILFAALIWIRQLRRLSEQRGRELLKENIEKLNETLRVAERTRLAVELHDTISQNLTGVALELEASTHTSAKLDPQLVTHLKSAADTLRSCRVELKNCIWDLKSNALEAPTLDAAIRKTLIPHLKGVRLAVRFAVPRYLLTDNTCHTLLSIIRELTVNGIRHGHATDIKVAGAFENGKLLFSVTDNGCGFNPLSAPGIAEGHFGLEGISERLSNMDGTLTLDSAPGKGCKATVAITLPRKEQ